jgi:hypothetical protein
MGTLKGLRSQRPIGPLRLLSRGFRTAWISYLILAHFSLTISSDRIQLIAKLQERRIQAKPMEQSP